MNEARVDGPVKSGKSQTFIKAVTEHATKPSQFIETQEESPEP